MSSDVHNDVVVIGPFLFLKSAFGIANAFLKTLNGSKNTYVLLDELGKLELKNQGLHNAAQVLIPNYITHPSKHLIIVVRHTLLEPILGHYKIVQYKLLDIETLKSF